MNMNKLLFICFLAELYAEKVKVNYRIQPERAEVVYYDPKFVSHQFYKFTKINRTHTSFNTNMTLLQTLEENSMIHLKGFKWYNSGYQLYPYVIKRSFCNFLKIEFLIIKEEFVKVSNLPVACPIRKGDYYVKDFIMNPIKIPQGIRRGKYMVEANVTDPRKQLKMSVRIYGTLDYEDRL